MTRWQPTLMEVVLSASATWVLLEITGIAGWWTQCSSRHANVGNLKLTMLTLLGVSVPLQVLLRQKEHLRLAAQLSAGAVFGHVAALVSYFVVALPGGIMALEPNFADSAIATSLYIMLGVPTLLLGSVAGAICGAVVFVAGKLIRNSTTA